MCITQPGHFPSESPEGAILGVLIISSVTSPSSYFATYKKHMNYTVSVKPYGLLHVRKFWVIHAILESFIVYDPALPHVIMSYQFSLIRGVWTLLTLKTTLSIVFGFFHPPRICSAGFELYCVLTLFRE